MAVRFARGATNRRTGYDRLPERRFEFVPLLSVAAGGWSDIAGWLAGFAIGRSRQSGGPVIMLEVEQWPLGWRAVPK